MSSRDAGSAAVPDGAAVRHTVGGRLAARGVAWARRPGALVVAGAYLAALAVALRACAVALEQHVPLRSLLARDWLGVVVALMLSVAVAVLAGGRWWRSVAAGGAPRAFWHARRAIEIVTVATVIGLVALQPFRRVVFELWLGVAAGGFGAWVLAAAALERRAPRRVALAVDVALFHLCLAPWALELCLQVAARVVPSPVLTTPRAGVESFIAAYRYAPGTPRFAFPCDRNGNYDREPQAGSDVPLVVCVGDSFSQGVVPQPLHYTSVCERELGIEVYNIGVDGVGPPEYAFLLEHEGLPARPDAVVIGIFVGNDIDFIDYRDPQPTNLLARWFGAEHYLTVTALDRLARIRRERLATAQRAVGEAQDEHSRFGKIVDTPEAARAAYPWVSDPLRELPTFSEDQFLGMQRTRARAVLSADDAPYAGLFPVLLEMRQKCGDLPFFLLLLPDEVQVDDELWRAIQTPGSPTLEREKPQRMIGAWAREQGIELIDPLPALRAVDKLPDGRPHVYHLRNTHLNTRGNEVVGRVLADALRARGLAGGSARAR